MWTLKQACRHLHVPFSWRQKMCVPVAPLDGSIDLFLWLNHKSTCLTHGGFAVPVLCDHVDMCECFHECHTVRLQMSSSCIRQRRDSVRNITCWWNAVNSKADNVSSRELINQMLLSINIQWICSHLFQDVHTCDYNALSLCDTTESPHKSSVDR